MENKIYNLSIYLLKETVKTFDDAVEFKRFHKEYVIKDTYNIDGIIYIGQPKSKPAKWLDLLRQAVDETIGDIESVSNRALLLIKIETRIYALPFGYGKHMLKEGVIDRDIALKTALNLINPDSLRSLDRANLDNLNIFTKTQSSSKAKQENFNVDPIKDLLKGVTGGVDDDKKILGENATGSDGIYLNPNINFKHIKPILDTINAAINSSKYKEKFDWIDNLKQEKDPVMIQKLQEQLLDDLYAQDTKKIILSPYMIIRWEAFEGVSYTPKGELQQDFNMESFYLLNKKEITKDWSKFLTFRIYFKLSDYDEPKGIPLWKCINYETLLGGFLYVLMDGTWYKINEKYANDIKEYALSYEESTIEFIDCDQSMKEADYNMELANSESSNLLLDQKFIKTDYLRSKVELCDVLTKSKELIHVKFYRDSAGLSHLFSQGRISANLLMKDKTFRKNARAKLASLKFDRDLIPLENTDLVRSDYTITFAIIDDKKRSFVDTLPFFSLLNFRLTAEELSSWGYEVRVKKINMK